MKMRARKRRTDAAMAAWRVIGLSPWKPVGWFRTRHPRSPRWTIAPTIGSYIGFSIHPSGIQDFHRRTP